MSLSTSEVQHVAALARLGLDPEETERLRDQLSNILEHIDVLSRIDTGSIPPTAQVNSLRNVLRNDEVGPSLSQGDVLGNAPAQRNGFFEVRAVLGGGTDVKGSGSA